MTTPATADQLVEEITATTMKEKTLKGILSKIDKAASDGQYHLSLEFSKEMLCSYSLADTLKTKGFSVDIDECESYFETGVVMIVSWRI